MTFSSATTDALVRFKDWNDEDLGSVRGAVGAYELAAQKLAEQADLDEPTWALLSQLGSVASAQLLESAVAAEEAGDLARGELLSAEGARIARSLATLVRLGGAEKAVRR
jgi:hypothetical protein